MLRPLKHALAVLGVLTSLFPYIYWPVPEEVVFQPPTAEDDISFPLTVYHQQVKIKPAVEEVKSLAKAYEDRQRKRYVPISRLKEFDITINYNRHWKVSSLS